LDLVEGQQAKTQLGINLFTYYLMLTLALLSGSVWIVWYQHQLLNVTLQRPSSSSSSEKMQINHQRIKTRRRS